MELEIEIPQIGISFQGQIVRPVRVEIPGVYVVFSLAFSTPETFPTP